MRPGQGRGALPGLVVSYVIGCCHGCSWCPRTSLLRTPDAISLSNYGLAYSSLPLYLENFSQQNGSLLIWEVMLPHSPSGYGQRQTDRGYRRLAPLPLRWYYPLVQFVLQNSLWDQVEAEFPVRPHDNFTPSPASSCFPHSSAVSQKKSRA